jgi:hypothetical protein
MQYIYYQSVVQFRVPIKDDGSIGMPEPVKAFSTCIRQEKPKSKPKMELKATTSEEELL